MTGYIYRASEGSAMSKWHPAVPESWETFLDLKDEIKNRSGISELEIQQDRCKIKYYLVWQYIWNMFKSGCPLTFIQKYSIVKEYMGDSSFKKSCIQHDWSHENIYYRLYHLCIRLRSPLLMSMLFLCQHEIKKIINKIKR